MSVQTNRVAVASQSLLLSLIIALTPPATRPNPRRRLLRPQKMQAMRCSQAAKAGDQNAVLVIFGPKSKELIYSGDVVQDKTVTDAFVSAYEQMHRWRKMPDGAQVLLGRRRQLLPSHSR